MISVRARDRSFSRHFCGPLEVRLTADDPTLASQALKYFSLHSRTWADRTRTVHIDLRRGVEALAVRGDFLRSARMNVDLSRGGYLASSVSGFSARGIIGARSDRWEISAPAGLPFSELQVVELQDMLVLASTVGWRTEGWIPLHAATVAKGGACALLCAPSGCGKSTLTTALIRNGWQTLGDDKVLVRCDGRTPRVAALLQTFHLHPRTDRWFAELANLDGLPRYSEWTEKRCVSVDHIVGGGMRAEATPTHVVQLIRDPGLSGARATPMPAHDVLPTILRQIVISSDPDIARQIVTAAARVARNLRGFVFAVGDEAYRETQWLKAFEQATQ